LRQTALLPLEILPVFLRESALSGTEIPQNLGISVYVNTL